MLEELKPCPFCVLVPELKFWDQPIESSGTGYCFYIECKCGLQYNGNYRFEYDSDCIAAWNRRASPWVSVKIEPPPIMEPVLLRDNANCCFGWRDPIPAEFITSDNALFSDYVMLATKKRINFEPTHWMPIPKLPEEE